MEMQGGRVVAQRKPKRRVRIEGNDVLYHFFQKTLLDTDDNQFRELAVRLIDSLSIWLPPAAYQRFPVALPFAVRDPTSRGNKSKGIVDQWGAPNEGGYFRDDNSLVKSLPRSLAITNPSNPLVDGRYIGTSFVASHIWRLLPGGGFASQDVLTYSFLPNLVWLPAQVSKLSDREGSFVQSYLQALSLRIYRDVELTPKLTTIVEPIWDRLQLRPEIAALPLPEPSTLNYFKVSGDWIERKRRTLTTVVAGIRAAHEGDLAGHKIVSSRYAEGLPRVSQGRLKSLLAWLVKYETAVREAAGSQLSVPEG